MRSIKHTGWVMAFGCAALLAAPLASAGQRHHSHRHGDAVVGAALVIGAAALIASSQNHQYRRDQRYGGYYSNGSGYENVGYGRPVASDYGYGAPGYDDELDSNVYYGDNSDNYTDGADYYADDGYYNDGDGYQDYGNNDGACCDDPNSQQVTDYGYDELGFPYASYSRRGR